MVDAAIHDGDFALTKGVVEHVIEGGHVHAEAIGSVAVDNELSGEAVILLVAIGILQLGNLLEAIEHDGRPMVELIEIVGLKRVLELSLIHI